MSKTKLLPKKININEEIDIIKISMKNDDDKINDILCVFKNNLEHLFYWNRHSDEVFFNTIDDIKKHHKNNYTGEIIKIERTSYTQVLC